jgi:hypothetical protein
LQVAYEDVFFVSLALNISGADIDYCRLFDFSSGGFTNQDIAAYEIRGDDVWLVPPGGSGIGDCIYFGYAGNSHRLDIRICAPNAGNTFVWEYWNGAAWAALVGLTDGTVGLSVNGAVTWTNDLGSTIIDGVTTYWVRARVSVAGASVPIAYNAHFAPHDAVDFDSLGVHGSHLHVEIYRKIGGSYRNRPSSYEIYKQSEIDQDIEISGLRCYTDTKIVLRASVAPTVAVTVNYNGVVVTEYEA